MSGLLEQLVAKANRRFLANKFDNAEVSYYEYQYSCIQLFVICHSSCFPFYVTRGLTAIHFPSAKYFGTYPKFSTPENVVTQRLYVMCYCSSICIIVVVYI